MAFASTGAELAHMSERTGVSVEALSELKFAADQSGVGVEELETGIKKMQKSLEGSTPAFAKLGLDMIALRNMSPQDALAKIGEKLSAIENPTLKASLALEIFGRAGTKMIPMLADMGNLMQDARDSGVTMSAETAQSALELEKALARVHAQIKALWVAIGAAFAPALKEFVAQASRIVMTAINWVKANAGLASSILRITTILIGASVAVIGLGFAIVGVGSVLTTVGAALVMVGSVIGAIGFGGALALVVALGAAFAFLPEILGGVASAWKGVSSDAMAGWGDLVDAVKSGDLESAMKIAWAGIKLVWAEGLNALKIKWDAFAASIILPEAQTGLAFTLAKAGEKLGLVPEGTAGMVKTMNKERLERVRKGTEGPGGTDLAGAAKDVDDAKAAFDKARSDAKLAMAARSVGDVIAGSMAAIGTKKAIGGEAGIPLGAQTGTFNKSLALRLPGKGDKQTELLTEIKLATQGTFKALQGGSTGARFA